MKPSFTPRKQILFFTIIFICTCVVEWFLVGRHLSFPVYDQKGRFIYNAPPSLWIMWAEVIGISAVYSLIALLLIKKNNSIAKISLSIITLLLLFFSIIYWLGGERPDIEISRHGSNQPSLGQDSGEAPQVAPHSETRETIIGTAGTSEVVLLSNTDQVTKNGIDVTQLGPDASTMTMSTRDLGIAFTYPLDLPVKEVEKFTRKTLIGDIEDSVPKGSWAISDALIISKIPYAEISRDKAIIDWESCCSGIRYWFNKSQQKWNAENFKVLQPEDIDVPKKEQVTKKTLKRPDGLCVLKERFGKNDFYVLSTTEEGVPIDTSYYLMSEGEYVIRVVTNYDIREHPTSAKSQIIKDILASITLEDQKTISVQCN